MNSTYRHKQTYCEILSKKFIIRIASEKFSRYKLLGNEINEVNISLFGLNAFMIIRKTGSIKIIPRHSHKMLFKTTVSAFALNVVDNKIINNNPIIIFSFFPPQNTKRMQSLICCQRLYTLLINSFMLYAVLFNSAF